MSRPRGRCAPEAGVPVSLMHLPPPTSPPPPPPSSHALTFHPYPSPLTTHSPSALLQAAVPPPPGTNLMTRAGPGAAVSRPTGHVTNHELDMCLTPGAAVSRTTGASLHARPPSISSYTPPSTRNTLTTTPDFLPLLHPPSVLPIIWQGACGSRATGCVLYGDMRVRSSSDNWACHV